MVCAIARPTTVELPFPRPQGDITDSFGKVQNPLTRQIVQMYGINMSSIRLDREDPSRANIVQIRDLLGQRFPQVRMTLAEKSFTRPCFATGLPQIDGLLQGGLPKGAVTELVSPDSSGGGALALRRIVRIAGQNRQRVALIDGSDGFDPTALTNELLAGLLWVRCCDGAQALKATDLVLRDGNLPLVILDLHHNAAAQLRKIPGTTWYRLQRIIEPTPTALLVMTPRAMVSSAEARLSLANEFTFASWEQTEEELISRMKVVLQRSAATEVHESRLVGTEVG
jgi:hypothetical protein